MNRRGQIFLLITILVITFLVGISTTLLEIQRSNYIEVTPETDTVLTAWENLYDSIVQIYLNELSINSLAGTVDNTPLTIDQYLNNVETYFNSRGLSTIIEETSQTTYYIAGGLTTDSSVNVTGSFYVHLSSGNVEINQNFDLSIEYNLIAVNNANVVLTETINDQVEFITGASFNLPGFVDNNTGGYTHSQGAGVPGICTTTNNIEILFLT